MQPITGPFSPINMGNVGNVGSVGSTSAPSGATTMQAVNNITTALIGANAPVMSTSQVITCTLSSALGSSIGSLVKSSDNNVDLSEEPWAQEVLTHQDGTKQLSQDFNQTMAKEGNKLGHSGLDVPGFSNASMKSFFDEEAQDEIEPRC